MDSLKYHRSMLISGALHKGNGWAMSTGRKAITLFMPAPVDPKMALVLAERKAKKNAKQTLSGE